MSNSRDCQFFLATDDQWYMGLESDRGSGEYQDFGPFQSQEVALAYLRRNFSNPGGFDVDDSGTLPPPAVLTPRVRPSWHW